MTARVSQQHSCELVSSLWEHRGDVRTRVTVIQRPATGTRSIANMPSLLGKLADIPGLVAKEVRFETWHVVSQIAIANNTNVLVGVHGAGLAWMSMLPPGAGVVEL